MKKNDWKKRDGVVYSTNSEYEYQQPDAHGSDTLIPGKQNLRVSLDTSGRQGKQVTVVSGFVGTSEDCDLLCKKLKTRCGTGGTVKLAEMLIQGDKRKLVGQALSEWGYRVRVI